MIPCNPDATAQDHLAAARDGLPCNTCGGPGWTFGGGYGIVCCADCNDDEDKPKPVSLPVAKCLSRPPEPWTEDSTGWRYFCGQCRRPAVLIAWSRAGLWWVCECLAVAETVAGVVVLKFPQPVRAR